MGHRAGAGPGAFGGAREGTTRPARRERGASLQARGSASPHRVDEQVAVSEGELESGMPIAVSLLELRAEGEGTEQRGTRCEAGT